MYIDIYIVLNTMAGVDISSHLFTFKSVLIINKARTNQCTYLGIFFFHNVHIELILYFCCRFGRPTTTEILPTM